MTTDDQMDALRGREELARARIRRAARGVKETVVDAVLREKSQHPWVLPVAGFCAGLLIPFLVPSRRRKVREEVEEELEESASAIHDAWADARDAAAETITVALGAAIRRLLGATRSTECPNGSSR